jgi:heterodisulfide reductase subunit C
MESPGVTLDFVSVVDAASGQEVSLCYHCHKCTSGCPVSADMDLGPDRVLRLLQMGQRERLLASPDIWLCAGCETCATRCPNGIDIARVMDALRQIGLEAGVKPGEGDAYRFHRLFLLVVRTLGRMHEAALLGAYKIWTGHVLSDLDSGAALFVKGKIPLMPRRLTGITAVQKLFDHSPEAKGSGGEREA